ncbi:MAG: nuclear transport factor 2 family protein [Pseudomonadota bacterium]
MTPREAIQDLMVEYGLLIDEDRLEDWVSLFAERCSYRVVSRENVEQGLPQVLMLCTNKDMLHDRVASYRHVNEYNLHSDRHVIGAPRFHGEQAGVWRIEASYSLFQTDVEGVSRLFSVGRYDATVVFEQGRAWLRDMTVIVDTAAIPTLLATPI